MILKSIANCSNRQLINAVLILFAVFLPAIVYHYFDPGFSFFVAPILIAEAGVCALIAWLIFKLLRFPYWLRHSLLITASLIFSYPIGKDLHHTYTAEGRFERLLLNPVPDSVRFIDSGGHVAMAGGEEWITFTIKQSDFHRILRAGSFKEFDPSSRAADSLENGLIRHAKKIGIDPVDAYKSGGEDGGSFLFLVTNEDKSKALLYRFRL